MIDLKKKPPPNPEKTLQDEINELRKDLAIVIQYANEFWREYDGRITVTKGRLVDVLIPGEPVRFMRCVRIDDFRQRICNSEYDLGPMMRHYLWRFAERNDTFLI